MPEENVPGQEPYSKKQRDGHLIWKAPPPPHSQQRAHLCRFTRGSHTGLVSENGAGRRITWDQARPHHTVNGAGWAIPRLSGGTREGSLGEVKGCGRGRIETTTVAEHGAGGKERPPDWDSSERLCASSQNVLRRLTLKRAAQTLPHLQAQHCNPFLNVPIGTC